ncbi:RNI-like protein [Daedalea quercina L-15889]|uniref:RNI-like protein n=1 Tax=Daedalea quercina L-15889 TaxID=1314783 RepID=A0A165QQU7_9APHY|nr:RNI-like protein [Daedalea quercina L-15889]
MTIQTNADQQLPIVGTRIIHSGHLGTVRFVGKVDGTAGVWLGVEWDDPRRGKHDGVKDGRRYFSCAVPNAGSFIRPSSNISYGHSFLEALASKYIDVPHGSGLEKVVLGSSNGTIEVEAVGLDRIRGKLAHLERLREVSLDGEGVASADPPGAIAKACPGIRGLDLSKNLFPSWDVISTIVCELPNLQRLALNQNRLQSLTDHARALAAFQNITELQLNTTLTTWSAMQSIIRYMPALTTVEMGYNRIQSLSTGSDSPSKVEELNLDSNSLSSWSDICGALRTYTALQRLVLTSNVIESLGPISHPTESPLPRLKHLSLSFNRLSSWRDIDHLPGWCPTIESLSLTGNPLVEDAELGRNARAFAIAKIPMLTLLDAASVSAKERTDSELFYLSWINKNGPPDEEARCREHPRWSALCEKHGRPDTAPSTAQQRQDTLSSRLIEVKLYRTDTAPSGKAVTHTSDPLVLRVLPSMNIRTFHLKVTKSFKVPKAAQASIRLWLRMPDDRLVEIERDDNHDLDWWGVENGVEMLVFIKEH